MTDTTSTTVPQPNIAKWIEALRNDEFKQVTGSLCDATDDFGMGYCCLGVAEVLRLDNDHPLGGLPHPDLGEWLGIEVCEECLDSHDEWDPRINIPAAITPEQFLDALGEPMNDNYRELLSHVREGRGVKATVLNDEYLLSFAQIATLIERYSIADDNECEDD